MGSFGGTPLGAAGAVGGEEAGGRDLALTVSAGVRVLRLSEGEGLRFQDCAVALKGVLLKRGRLNGGYRPRLFALAEDGGLHYFKSLSGLELRPGSRVHLYECAHTGRIQLAPGGAPIDAGEQDGLHALVVAAADDAGGGGARLVHLAAPTRGEAEVWLAALRRVVGGLPRKAAGGKLAQLGQSRRSLF